MKRYFLIFLALITVALFVSYENMMFVMPAVLLFLGIVDRRAFRMILRWKFLAFLAILAFGVPVFVGEKDAALLGVPYSTEIFQMSLVMVNRSVIILLSVKMFTNRISVDQMASAMQRIRLKQFSHVFSIAMEVLPRIRAITLNTIRDYRQAPKTKNPLSELFDWVVKLIVKILHFSENYYTSNNQRR